MSDKALISPSNLAQVSSWLPVPDKTGNRIMKVCTNARLGVFRQTVEAIEWALQRRQRQPGYGPNARLLLNGKAEPYDRVTKGGNPNRQISNRFGNLIRQVRNSGGEIRSLSFGKLRKTAGNLIRQFADGEVAGVFLSHGQPVQTDDLLDLYSGRPFGRVFQAIREVEKYLGPMFSAAGSAPFAQHRGEEAVRAKTKQAMPVTQVDE